MTIKDIAKLAGVSVSTVSRVLNNHPDVSKDAYNKVMAIVEENNYIPNTSARDLGKATSNNIGVIVRGMSNPFFTKIIYEINERVEKNGYTMVMQQISASDDEIMAGALMEREKKLKGLIFLGGRLDYTPQQVSCIGVPFVCCTFNNKYGTLDKSDYSSVAIDDNQAAYDAVEKLFNEGHRKIAVVLSRPDDGSVSQVRYEGYLRALNDFGLELDDNLVISVNSFNIADAYSGVKEWLDNDFDFSAMFCIADNMAMGAMRALRESDFSIPGDISVVAIDGIEFTEYTNPQLSTFCQPMQRMGKDSVDILIDIIEGRGHHRQVELSTIFRVGATIGTFK
mgnify:FL=1